MAVKGVKAFFQNWIGQGQTPKAEATSGTLGGKKIKHVTESTTTLRPEGPARSAGVDLKGKKFSAIVGGGMPFHKLRQLAEKARAKAPAKPKVGSLGARFNVKPSGKGPSGLASKIFSGGAAKKAGSLAGRVQHKGAEIKPLTTLFQGATSRTVLGAPQETADAAAMQYENPKLFNALDKHAKSQGIQGKKKVERVSKLLQRENVPITSSVNDFVKSSSDGMIVLPQGIIVNAKTWETHSFDREGRISKPKPVVTEEDIHEAFGNELAGLQEEFHSDISKLDTLEPGQALMVRSASPDLFTVYVRKEEGVQKHTVTIDTKDKLLVTDQNYTFASSAYFIQHMMDHWGVKEIV